MATRRRKRKTTTATTWLWEFSKKVVCVVTALYFISFVFSMIVCWKELALSYSTTALSTLITEANETFRVVVGGYLIKAGVENACKIVKNKGEPASDTDDTAQG